MREREAHSIHVLIVDDSAVVRQVMTAVLSQEGNFRVTVAHDPLMALEKMKRGRPDVILLDLEMPRMDGLTFLRKVMAEDPIPVVVCSGLADEGTDAALTALREGAVEIVAKPKIGVRDFLEESAALLTEAIRGAAQARLRPGAPSNRSVHHGVAADVAPPRLQKPAQMTATNKVVAIGASTGGTEALRAVLEATPPGSPGIVIVQHMPEGFTAAFARQLDSICRLEVKEAANGDRLTEGRALIAPGNRHTVLVRARGYYAVEVKDGPLVSRHRPSVDVLFRSVAQAAGPSAIGVIMTGMGDDGATGLLEMKRAGAATIAQDESTSTVFGMPREAIALGAACQVLPLYKIPDAILALAWHDRRSSPRAVNQFTIIKAR